MNAGPEAPPGCRAHGHLLGALLAFGLLALILVACGISFGAGQDETEIFKRLTVEGDFSPGGSLFMILGYAQQYPVDVHVECVLLELDPRTATPSPSPEVTPSPTNTPAREPTPTPVRIPRPRPTLANRVLHILVQALPAVGTPEAWSPSEATPVRGVIEREFSAPERPGRYVVRCFTPDDDNNAISKTITIVPASTPTP